MMCIWGNINLIVMRYVASIIHFYCNNAAEALVESFNAQLPSIVKQFFDSGYSVTFVGILT